MSIWQFLILIPCALFMVIWVIIAVQQQRKYQEGSLLDWLILPYSMGEIIEDRRRQRAEREVEQAGD